MSCTKMSIFRYQKQEDLEDRVFEGLEETEI